MKQVNAYLNKLNFLQVLQSPPIPFMPYYVCVHACVCIHIYVYAEFTNIPPNKLFKGYNNQV